MNSVMQLGRDQWSCFYDRLNDSPAPRMHMNTFHTSIGLLYSYVRRITVCARANRSHRLRGFYYGRLHTDVKPMRATKSA
jgi:hypothetical protein